MVHAWHCHACTTDAVTAALCSVQQHTYIAFDTCVYISKERGTIVNCMLVWQSLGASFRILVPHVRCQLTPLVFMPVLKPSSLLVL